jgi:hypothetical protein
MGAVGVMTTRGQGSTPDAALVRGREAIHPPGVHRAWA